MNMEVYKEFMGFLKITIATSIVVCPLSILAFTWIDDVMEEHDSNRRFIEYFSVASNDPICLKAWGLRNQAAFAYNMTKDTNDPIYREWQRNDMTCASRYGFPHRARPWFDLSDTIRFHLGMKSRYESNNWTHVFNQAILKFFERKNVKESDNR